MDKISFNKDKGPLLGVRDEEVRGLKLVSSFESPFRSQRRAASRTQYPTYRLHQGNGVTVPPPRVSSVVFRTL